MMIHFCCQGIFQRMGKEMLGKQLRINEQTAVVQEQTVISKIAKNKIRHAM